MKPAMSLAALSFATLAFAACQQQKAPEAAGGTAPATEEKPSPPTDDADPNFDPSQSPDSVDKDGEPGSDAALSVDEKKVTFAFDAAKLEGAAGDAVVFTVDHKQITSNQKCAAPLEHSPVGESGYDPDATTLSVEVTSDATAAAGANDPAQPDFEILETFTYACGKSPLSVTMINMNTGHRLLVTVTVHTKDATVYGQTKPFVALNKTDGEKALTLEYPSAE